MTDQLFRESISEMMDSALIQHRQGLIEHAALLYERVLQVSPRHADALHLLGLSWYQRGDPMQALRWISEAIALDSAQASYYSNLGLAYRLLGRLPEAIESYDKALSLQPDFVAALYNRGIALQEAGSLEQACASYASAIGLAPDHADALNNLGNALKALGKDVQALASYEQAIEYRPAFVDAINNRGNVLVRLGRITEAIAAYQQALSIKPEYVEAVFNLANLMRDVGRLDEACDLYSKASVLRPKDPIVYTNWGAALHRLGRPHDALRHYDEALKLNPDHFDALNNMGHALRELGAFDQALGVFELLTSRSVKHVDGWYNRGVTLLDLERQSEAVECFDQALALEPHFDLAWNARGVALRDLQCLEDGVASFQRAVEINPTCVAAWNNLGNALQDLFRLDQAMDCYDRALAVDPQSASVHNNRGNAQKLLKLLPEAEESYRRAIEIEPLFAEAQWNLSLIKLLGGALSDGWYGYEWRWKRRGTMPHRDYGVSQWKGQESIAEKRILIHAEQGLGDTIQFCRYATELARMGAHVVMEVQAPLKALLKSVKGVARLIERGEVFEPIDFHCPMLSLPLALGTDLQTVPAVVPYLQVGAQRLELWTQRLGQRRALRVGLAWSGSKDHSNDRRRSILLERIFRHLPEGLELHSLQREVRIGDEQALKVGVKDWRDELADFSDTAALIECLDLVISVDTSVAHLAGALGKPTWVLLPFVPDWRWMLEREDSPWYPSMKLYRQPSPGDWDSVLKRVRADLTTRFGTSAIPMA
jgi:tetratricopeptide (TPR) repeat protein